MIHTTTDMTVLLRTGVSIKVEGFNVTCLNDDVHFQVTNGSIVVIVSLM